MEKALSKAKTGPAGTAHRQMVHRKKNGELMNMEIQVTPFQFKGVKTSIVKNFNQRPEGLLETAESLDDTLFLPVLALAIKMQYPQEQDFYRDCVRLMTERFPDQVGDGDIMVKVAPAGPAGGEAYTFFIYTVDEDF